MKPFGSSNFVPYIEYLLNTSFLILCGDIIHCARKGVFQSAAAELHNPPRIPPLTLITAEDHPRLVIPIGVWVISFEKFKIL